MQQSLFYSHLVVFFNFWFSNPFLPLLSARSRTKRLAEREKRSGRWLRMLMYLKHLLFMVASYKYLWFLKCIFFKYYNQLNIVYIRTYEIQKYLDLFSWDLFKNKVFHFMLIHNIRTNYSSRFANPAVEWSTRFRRWMRVLNLISGWLYIVRFFYTKPSIAIEG